MAPARAWSTRNRAVSNSEVWGAPDGVPVCTRVPTNTTSGSDGTSQPIGTGTSHWRPDVSTGTDVGGVVTGGDVASGHPGGRSAPSSPGASGRRPPSPSPTATAPSGHERGEAPGQRSTIDPWCGGHRARVRDRPSPTPSSGQAVTTSGSVGVGVAADLELHAVGVAEEQRPLARPSRWISPISAPASTSRPRSASQRGRASRRPVRSGRSAHARPGCGGRR